ncbi:hypothetical protein [Pseudonocardia humida]|uniref:Uncharacterized protein n=1 Tax=Pseudonocardia humida TaxID=2800819 RepID=A0ABT1A519_9PSEU|nr:hypothetical protein [Pseudonocardia humida]MCO1657859.1 hypothetical protein [Pseudonocardia humida]
MAKGKSGGVVAAVVLAAVLIAGNDGSGRDGDPGTGATGSTGTGASTDGQVGDGDGGGTSDGGGDGEPAAPLYGPVPGQRDKDQAPSVALVPDAVADECVLSAPEAEALVRLPVERTVMTSVPGPEETPAPGCVAVQGENQQVLMNVYEVRGGSPAEAVRARDGARPLDGVGEAAAIVMARTGPTLYVAGQRFLVTVAVAFREPDDDAWRAAGRAALDRVE